jgi:hypothetical protein
MLNHFSLLNCAVSRDQVHLFIVFHVCTSFCRIVYACFTFLRSFKFLMAICSFVNVFFSFLYVFRVLGGGRRRAAAGIGGGGGREEVAVAAAAA